MGKLSWALLAMSLLLGCDAEVGSEPCTGTSCVEPTPTLSVRLAVNYVRVSTAAPLDLPIVGTSESPCDPPCTEPVRLYRAAGNAAWTIARVAGPPTLKMLRASGEVTDVQVGLPEGDTTINSLFVSSGLDGRVLAHVTWNLPRGSTLDELALINQPVNQPGDMARHTIGGGKTRPPRGAILAPQGFLLFDGPPQTPPVSEPTRTLRLVDANGATLWQQARFPLDVAVVGTSAVALANGFVVGAGSGTTREAEFGLLSLDATGKLTRYGTSADSKWRSARLVSLGPTAYAMAAESELDAVVDTINSGNLDVLIDRGDGNALTGFRLERFCLFELTLYGFSADELGNLYLSSVTGEKDAPRGLLCELPSQGTARCFQGAPNQMFGDIVATGGGSLFVVAGQQILRVQLPD